jgi:general L-amino acid transport system substrate-binding protein
VNSGATGVTRALVRIVLATFFLLSGSVAYAQATLSTIKARGMLNCGVYGALIGFSAKDAQAHWSGLDVDYCRAVAAAIFNDVSKVAFIPVSSKDRFTALKSGQIDVLLRDTTWTSLRDTSLGVTFTGVNFYDHQAFMVRKLQVKSTADLNNLAVCVVDDTTTILNLTDFASTRNLSFKILPFSTSDQAIAAYDSKRCDAYTADYSGLLAAMHQLTQPDLNAILDDVIAKEPLSPSVRKGDEAWFDIIKWVHFAMLLAEEAGVTSVNVDDRRKSDIPAIKRLLGVDGNQGEILGLSNDWAYRIVKLVGNYGEVFERDVGQSSPLKLPRGYNALWSKGGLQYAPPIR